MTNVYKYYFNKRVMFYNKDFMDFLHHNNYVTNAMNETYLNYFENERYPELILYPRTMKEYTKLIEKCFNYNVVYCVLNKEKKFTVDNNTENMVILIDTCYIKQAKL